MERAAHTIGHADTRPRRVRRPSHRGRPAASSRSQHGAALIVGLVLLLALTILGISGMNMSTLELTMAGNLQAQEAAFQAAETGIDIAIGNGPFPTAAPGTMEDTPLGDGSYSATAVTTCMGTSGVPDVAFSMGLNGGAVQAYHFDVVATGSGPRGATATHTQGFYVVGPGGGPGC